MSGEWVAMLGCAVAVLAMVGGALIYDQHAYRRRRR